MSYREFRDASGVRWEVWEVQPALLERRIGGGEPPADMDRRASGRRRAPVAHELRFGWLVFESEGEKRRVAPVPLAWDTLDDHGLAALLAQAPAGPGPRIARTNDAPMISPPAPSVSSGLA